MNAGTKDRDELKSIGPMTRISSKATRYYKFLFPVLWLSILIVVASGGLYAYVSSGQQPPVTVFIAPLFMAVLGVFVMRALIFDLVDEVWDTGNTLIVINKGKRRTIPLSRIMNVNYSTTNPRRVRLTLTGENGELEEIVFSPTTRSEDFFHLLRNSVADDLVRRIHGMKKA